jgi:hypothetical protein
MKNMAQHFFHIDVRLYFSLKKGRLEIPGPTLLAVSYRHVSMRYYIDNLLYVKRVVNLGEGLVRAELVPVPLKNDGNNPRPYGYFAE